MRIKAPVESISSVQAESRMLFTGKRYPYSHGHRVLPSNSTAWDMVSATTFHWLSKYV